MAGGAQVVCYTSLAPRGRQCVVDVEVEVVRARAGVRGSIVDIRDDVRVQRTSAGAEVGRQRVAPQHGAPHSVHHVRLRPVRDALDEDADGDAALALLLPTV